MKNRKIFAICSLLFPFFAWSDEWIIASKDTTVLEKTELKESKEIRAIDKRIKHLQAELDKNQRLEMREEVKGRGHEIGGDQSKYAKDLEKSAFRKKRIKKL